MKVNEDEQSKRTLGDHLNGVLTQLYYKTIAGEKLLPFIQAKEQAH